MTRWPAGIKFSARGEDGEIVCRAGAWFVEPGIEKTSPIAARNNLGQLDVGISARAFYSIHLASLDFKPI